MAGELRRLDPHDAARAVMELAHDRVAHVTVALLRSVGLAASYVLYSGGGAQSLGVTVEVTRLR